MTLFGENALNGRGSLADKPNFSCCGKLDFQLKYNERENNYKCSDYSVGDKCFLKHTLVHRFRKRCTGILNCYIV